MTSYKSLKDNNYTHVVVSPNGTEVLISVFKSLKAAKTFAANFPVSAAVDIRTIFDAYKQGYLSE